MDSDFTAARIALEQALERLQGDDATSVQAREALDVLIEAIIAAEFTRQPGVANIIRFRASR